MDLKEIQELIKLIDESELTTLELEKEGFRIVLKKEKKVASGGITQGSLTEQGTAVPLAILQPQRAQAQGAQSSKGQTVNSPIVGTFYASSSPGGEPFVQPGNFVKKGDTLCIIEAMKLMNEIEAEEDLQIADVLVQDGQMVEYSQPLFVVKK